MIRARIATGITIAVVCVLGALLLHLLGMPLPAAITIGVLAAVSTAFTRWARALHLRRGAHDPADRTPLG